MASKLHILLVEISQYILYSGTDTQPRDQEFLESLVAEVENNVEGRRVYKQEDVDGGPLRESKA